MSAVVALQNCARAVRKGTDVKAELVIADYGNNVIEDVRREREGGDESRPHLSVIYTKEFIL